MSSKRKEERYSYVRKRADELAVSGKYRDWLSIETAIIGEGYGEARSILDDKFIRDNLNELCNTAQSQPETLNRNLFQQWINNFIVPNFQHLQSEFPEVRLHVKDSAFSFIRGNTEIDIQKSFPTRRLAGNLYFVETDGHRYVSFYDHFVDKDFDQFNLDDLRATIRIVTQNK
jgi:hypothetical protein